MSLKTYTVKISWMTWGGRDYIHHYKTLTIQATSILEASEKALVGTENMICPAISSIWYN